MAAPGLEPGTYGLRDHRSTNWATHRGDRIWTYITDFGGRHFAIKLLPITEEVGETGFEPASPGLGDFQNQKTKK